MNERVSQAEAARRLGVTRQAINAKIRRGTLAMTGGLVDLDEAAGAMVPAGLGDSTAPPSDEVATYRKSRAVREHYAALDARLSYERACAQLVDAEAVGMAVTTAAATLRLTLDALPDKLAARLATETDEAACAALLQAAINEALEELMTALRDALEGTPPRTAPI
jgi:hypothetical protein